MFVCLQYGALNGHRAWKLSRLLLVLDILGHEETRKLDYTFHNFNSPCTQNYLSGRLRTSGILVLYGINTYLKVTDVYANVLRLWQSKTSILFSIKFIYLEMQKEMYAEYSTMVLWRLWHSVCWTLKIIIIMNNVIIILNKLHQPLTEINQSSLNL